MAHMPWFLWFTFCSSIFTQAISTRSDHSLHLDGLGTGLDVIVFQNKHRPIFFILFLRTSMFWMAVDPRVRRDVQDRLGTQST